MKTVIVLSGKKSSGKDTSFAFIKKAFECPDCFGSGFEDGQFPDYLGSTKSCETCHLFGYGFLKKVKKISFADPLKSLCQAAFGLTKKQCYGESGERETDSSIAWMDLSPRYHVLRKPDSKKYLTARQILQFVGTNVMRQFYPNIWSKAATISALKAEVDIVVFTDARFPNEIEEFQKLADQGEIHLVVIRLYRDTGLEDAHESETALDSWDKEQRFQYGLFNNGTLEELSLMLKDILKKEGLLNVEDS